VALTVTGAVPAVDRMAAGTVIDLLQDADGSRLTTSARRR
jgi:hypothetical protein